MKIRLTILASIMLIGCATKSDLTKEDRKEFIEDYIYTCELAQKNIEANIGISDEKITEYCRCLANVFVDQITYENIQQAEAGDNRGIAKAIKAVESNINTCAGIAMVLSK